MNKAAIYYGVSPNCYAMITDLLLALYRNSDVIFHFVWSFWLLSVVTCVHIYMNRFSGSNIFSWHYCTFHRVWSQINYVKCCVFIWSWWKFLSFVHTEKPNGTYMTHQLWFYLQHMLQKNTQNHGSNKHPHNCYSFPDDFGDSKMMINVVSVN